MDKLKSYAIKFSEKYGTTDLHEEGKIQTKSQLYKSLVKNTMARIYTYCI